MPPLLSGIGLAAPFLESILGALGGPVLPSTDEASALRGFAALFASSFIPVSLAFPFAVLPFALGLLVFPFLSTVQFLRFIPTPWL